MLCVGGHFWLDCVLRLLRGMWGRVVGRVLVFCVGSYL